MPLSFEPNRGQTSDAVQWVARGPEYALFLSGHDAVLELNSVAAKKGMTDRPKIESAAVRMNLLGAKTVKETEGEEPQAGKANYFTGRDQSKWLSEVPMFGKVRLREVYPGIDLVYYGRQGRLEYDFVVAPGADPGRIALGFEGAKAGVAADGDLVLPIEGEGESLRPTSQNRDVGHPSILPTEIRFDKPVVYQMKDGVREPVAGGFRVASDGKVSFALGKYDRSRELVIDPTLVFEGEIGTGNQQTIPTGMVVDSLGEMVITGYTNDLTFPTTTGAYQTTCSSATDPFVTNGMKRCGASSAPSAFVTKLSADGGSLIYSTYLHGGGGFEEGQSVAVDAAGDAYILGQTSSNDFPITANAYQKTCQPTATGTNGAPVSQCDNFSNGGGTEYTVNGPTLFIAKLNPLGTALLYSTFFGGTAAVSPVGIALDSAGNMVFASSVSDAFSPDVAYPSTYHIQFPVTETAYQTQGINITTPALSKLSADGQTLLYSTFLGSQTLNVGHESYNQAFALGQNGIAFIGGYTATSDFPTTAGSVKPSCTLNANNPSYCQTTLGFVAAIDTTAAGNTSLVYASYLGGETTQGSNIPEQEVAGLAADANNDLFVTGYTSAVNFPTTTGAFQTTCPVQGNTGSCPETAFLTKINPAGSALAWSTFVGGTVASPPVSYGEAIALDSQGRVYLYGFSQDTGASPQMNPVQTDNGGNRVFVTEFTPDGTTLVFGSRFGTASTTVGSGAFPAANGIAVDAAGNMYITGFVNDGGTFGTTMGTYSTPATNGFNRTFFAKISPNSPPSPNNGLTTNLLLNPGAELGSIADWTPGGGGTPTVDTGTYDVGINPHTGSYDFLGGSGNPTDSLSQTVSIIQQGITAAQVDGGTLFANVSFWEQGLNQGDPSDSGSVTLTFLNASNAAISTVTIGPEDSHSGAWGNVTGIPAIPAGTRSITYTMNFIRNVGNNNDAFLDDNVLSIHTNTGLTISPSTLHFGNVPVGTLSQSQTVTVTNQQTTAITIDQIISELGANPSDFGVSTYCPQGQSLAAGASCPVTITFAPDGVGAKSAGIAINTESVPSLQQISVDGTGTGGILQVNPGNLKTIAGNGTSGYTGDGGLATAAELMQPNGVAFDPAGNLYIADTEANVIRKVDTTGKITTFAGDGTGGFAGDGGPATQAELLIPFSVASDKNGNIYIQDTGNSVIRKVDTTGKITTVAGTPGTPGRSGDGGPATAAKLNENQGARFDSAGNFYVALCPTGTVRKIDTTGIITTVAGTPGTPGFSGDGGPATAAELQCPSGVAIDAAGNFYIADEFNQVIRKVTAATGVISTIAGTPGVAGNSGDGGAATAATFNDPNDVTLDAAGNLYVADSGNNRVRKIDTNGVITTAAGGLNSAGSAAVNTPLAATVDTAGNVYFSDSGNSAIREIFPKGTQPFPATTVGATSSPKSLTLSNIGNVDVTLAADGAFTTSGNTGDFALSAGTCTGGAVLTANGGSCAVSLTFTPTAVGQRTLTVTIADDALNTPQSFSIGGTGETPAGQTQVPVLTWPTPAAITSATPLSATQLDATAADAGGTTVPGTFVYTPAAGTLLPAGTQTLSVVFTPTDTADFTTATGTTTIMVTNAAPSFVSNVGTALAAKAVGISVANAGTLNSIQVLTQGVTGLDFTAATGGSCTTGSAYTVGQSCTVNVIFDPQHAGNRPGAVLLLDGNKNTLGIAYLQGSGVGPQIIFGAGSQSVLGGGFNSPQGLGLDGSGNVYVADQANGAVKEIPAGCTAANCVRTLASGFKYPNGLSVDGAGNLFFDDFTNSNNSGSSSSDNLAEEIPFGCASASCFRSLGSGFDRPAGIAVDVNGNVFVSDWGNNAVKELLAVNGVIPQTPTINVLAGGFTGQTGPDGLTLDASGNVFVADHDDGHALYEIPIAGGYSTLNTISNSFTAPEDVAFDGTGNAYVVDEDTNALYKLPAVGGSLPATPSINTLANNFNSPEAVVVDALGNVYVSDNGNQRVVKIDYSDAPSLSFATATAVGSTDTTDGPQQFTIQNNGNAALTFTGIAASTNFKIDSTKTTCSTSTALAAGASCVVGVDLVPTAAGSLSGTLTVTDNALNAAGTTQSIPLSGTGMAVATVTPTITWAMPASISYGTPLSETQLDAVATGTNGVGVAGTFVYTPAAGTVLTAGTHTLNVAFTPTTAGYGPATGSTTITVTQFPVILTWPTPAAITTATPLSATQLDAAATDINGAPIPGTYYYTPDAGSLLAAGTQQLTVTFVPNDTVDFPSSVTTTRSIVVTQAAAATTVTTLAVTSGGNAATTVASGSVVTLTASLHAGTNSVSPAQIAFCDAAATSCAGAHVMATGQITEGGTAVYRFVPGIGTHSYSAVFLGTKAYAGSASAAATLAVTGTYATATTIAQSGTGGNPGNYTLTATVVGTSPLPTGPTGTVSFQDTSNGNAVLGTGALGAATAGFALAQAAGSPVTVGTEPYGMATGDFNGDGLTDLVVQNYGSNNVSVLLGKGDGTFQPQVTYAVGTLPERVLVADLDGDGNLDLVVANTGSNTISVLLGKGDGTFQAQVTYPCSSPVGLGVMDVNHDGIPDVVAGDYYSNTMSVLLGNGDGTLNTAVTYATGGTPQTLAEGDFNGDGNVDVVVGNFGGATVGVFLGNGDGTFQTMVTYGVGTQPQGVQVGDFNGDGKQDLAVSNSGDGTVGVLLGNGDGTFQTMVTYPVGVQPVGIAIADFNGDGIADITVGNTGQASLTQSVLLGKGDGTFAPQATFATGNFPYGTTTGDFNGDGLPDIVAANYIDGTATIFLSQATETATAMVTGVSPTGAGTHAVVASYPGDANYGTSVSQATVLTVASPLALTSFTPVGALAGSGDTKITLTGTGFATTSVVMVNGAAVATTYVGPTTLTAVIPAALLMQTGSLAVTVADTSLDTMTAAQTFTVVQPVPAATLAGPATTPPGSQPTVTLSITNPYPLPLTAEFTLTFASAGATPVDDPAIQFTNGMRTYSYTVAANSTSVPPVELQAGTDAGTITIAAKLLAAGVDVTPSGLAPLVIVVPAVVPVISGTTITASGTTLTVVVHGFSNTREVSQAVFDFTAATGDMLATPMVTIPATTLFGTWYGSTESDAYGSTFTYTQVFNTSADASTVGQVKVTLTNSVGTSAVSTSP